MTLRTLTIALALGLSALLQGCGVAVVGAGVGAAALAIEDRRTAGMQIEDERIELQAGNRISDRFGDRVHASVTSYNRDVLLTGEVPDAQSKSEIERIVRSVTNVGGVINELEIAGVSALSARSNDAFITSKVKARFVDAQRFNPVHVKVVTEASVVYLMGIVTEKEANDATQIARTTGGVRKVIKAFQYCSPTDGACRPRTAAK